MMDPTCDQFEGDDVTMPDDLPQEETGVLEVQQESLYDIMPIKRKRRKT